MATATFRRFEKVAYEPGLRQSFLDLLRLFYYVSNMNFKNITSCVWSMYLLSQKILRDEEYLVFVLIRS